MTSFIAALFVAFGVVFVAELGDKTQLLALNFGARHSLPMVALGLGAGYGAANAVATLVGGVLGAALPQRPIEVVGGIVFLGFAVVGLVRLRTATGNSVTDARESSPATVSAGLPATRATSRSVVMSIAATIAIAEMGDKTQIATATLASQSSPAGVWVGATLGATASGMVGAVAGSLIGDRMPVRTLQLASVVLFAAFGVAMLAGWF